MVDVIFPNLKIKLSNFLSDFASPQRELNILIEFIYVVLYTEVFSLL